MHEYGKIQVLISLYSARCQVTISVRPLKTLYIQIYSLLRLCRIQRERKKNNKFSLRLYCWRCRKMLPY